MNYKLDGAEVESPTGDGNFKKSRYARHPLNGFQRERALECD